MIEKKKKKLKNCEKIQKFSHDPLNIHRKLSPPISFVKTDNTDQNQYKNNNFIINNVKLNEITDQPTNNSNSGKSLQPSGLSKNENIKANENEKLNFDLKDIFPSFILLKRIIVTEIPHLFDLGLLNETVITCSDLNSFVSPCYTDQMFSHSTIVKQIRETLESGTYEPFSTWNELNLKGTTYLAKSGIMSTKQQNVSNIKIGQYLHKAIEMRNQRISMKLKESEEKENNIVEEKDLLIEDIFVLGANAFLPSMTLVNDIGDDFFNQLINNH